MKIAKVVLGGVALSVLVVAVVYVFGLLGVLAIAGLWVALLLTRGWGSPLVRALLIALVLAVLIYFVSLFGFLFTISRSYEIGRDRWPYQLSSMAKVARAPAREVKAAYLGGFIDTAYSWRVPVPRERLGQVVRTSQLATFSASSVPDDFWTAFRPGWEPPRRADARFYATPDFPLGERGSDGDFLLGMYEENSQLFYVYMKANF